MVFSSPSTLWALGLLAIPIIIHLFEFRRYKKLYFSDTSLFKEIKAQSQTKNQLKHLLILASRLLFLALLILAFAEPIIPAEEGETKAPDIVSIYVDNSYSMTALGTNGSLLNEAVERAYRIADAYPAGTRFQLISNELSISDSRTLSLQDFQAKLDAIESSRIHRDLTDVVAFQSQALAGSALGKARAYYISDFNGMLPTETASISIDSNLRLRLLPLVATEASNVSVDSVWSELPIHQMGITQRLFFRLRNHGNEALVDQKVDVFLDDQLIASPIVSVPAEQGLDTNFQFEVESPGTLRGRIHVDDAHITYDNDLYFTLNITDKVKIVEISPKTEVSSPFARLFSGKHYSHQRLDPDRVIQDSLVDAQLLIINGVEEWNLALSSITELHLKNGGNILLVPSKRHSEELRDTWATQFDLRLGGLDSVNANVLNISPDQPLFKGVFESMNEDINLPRCQQAYTLNSAPGENVLPLPNNGSLLGANAVASGKVFFLTAPIERAFTNLTEHALFVPIMINMANQSGASDELFYSLEQSYIPWKGERSEDWRMRKEYGINSFIPSMSFNGLLMNGQIRSPGVYELYRNGKDSIWAAFAFNHNRQESDMNPVNEEALLGSFKDRDAVSITSFNLNNTSFNVETADLGTELWPWFVLLAFVFILLEVVLLKLFKL